MKVAYVIPLWTVFFAITVTAYSTVIVDFRLMVTCGFAYMLCLRFVEEYPVREGYLHSKEWILITIGLFVYALLSWCLLYPFLPLSYVERINLPSGELGLLFTLGAWAISFYFATITRAADEKERSVK